MSNVLRWENLTLVKCLKQIFALSLESQGLLFSPPIKDVFSSLSLCKDPNIDTLYIIVVFTFPLIAMISADFQ